MFLHEFAELLFDYVVAIVVSFAVVVAELVDEEVEFLVNLGVSDAVNRTLGLKLVGKLVLWLVKTRRWSVHIHS